MFGNDAKDLNEWKGEPARPGFNPDGSHHKVFESPTKWTESTEKKWQQM